MPVASSNVVLFQSSKSSTDRPARLDVGERRIDIRRLTRSMPVYQECRSAGIEREDIDQEILLRLMLRQRPGSRGCYDPLRAGFAKYVCTQAWGIMKNLLEKQLRTLRGQNEVVGVRRPELASLPYGSCDAALVAVAQRVEEDLDDQALDEVFDVPDDRELADLVGLTRLAA